MCHSPFIRMCVWRAIPPLISMRRCFPTACTRSMVRPTTSCFSSFGSIVLKRVITLPARASSRLRAARWIVSPSGTRRSQLISHRARSESSFDEHWRDGALRHWLRVDFGDEQRATSAAQNERGECAGDLARDVRARRLIVWQKRGDLFFSAADVRGELAIDEDYARADAARERERRVGPLHDRAVRIRGIGRGEQVRLRLLRSVAERTKKIEGGGCRELRRAESADEGAAPNAPRVFHGLEHGIDGAESAGDVLRRRRLARDDAVAREGLMRECIC